MRELIANTVADDLVKFLGNHPGHVACAHSVFPHAVNLLIQDDELITLTSHDDTPPMGLAVEPGTTFTEFLKAGDQVVLDLDRLSTSDRAFAIDLRHAEVWETRPIAHLAPRPVEGIAQARLDLIRWLGQQPAEGLLPLLPRLARQAIGHKPAPDNLFSRYIADDLVAFTHAINAFEWERALCLADRLIGFGMGSTPSCDDFLAAYLVVFNIADELRPGCFSWLSEFTQSIASNAKNRTTLISANMLRHAATGRTSQSHQRLLEACIFNHHSNLERIANHVLHHGATSGGDFLLGAICALEWVQKSFTTNLKEGECAWVDTNQPQPVPGI